MGKEVMENPEAMEVFCFLISVTDLNRPNLCKEIYYDWSRKAYLYLAHSQKYMQVTMKVLSEINTVNSY
jgi:hypothetical protein